MSQARCGPSVQRLLSLVEDVDAVRNWQPLHRISHEPESPRKLRHVEVWLQFVVPAGLADTQDGPAVLKRREALGQLFCDAVELRGEPRVTEDVVDTRPNPVLQLRCCELAREGVVLVVEGGFD